MSLREQPALKAAVVEAPLNEWALKKEMSIPEQDVIQL